MSDMAVVDDRVTLRVPMGLREQVRAVAEQLRTSEAWVWREAVERGLAVVAPEPDRARPGRGVLDHAFVGPDGAKLCQRIGCSAHRRDHLTEVRP